MGMPSKENDTMQLFFDYPTKHWCFKELKEKIDISDNRLSIRLKSLVNEKLITRVKEKNKMPYYIANWDSPMYKNKKKIFALEQLYDSGFLDHLLSLKAKTIIIFGSFSRWDWYYGSDIDLFVYGDADNLEIGKYETKLHREIQLFHAEKKKDLNRLGNALIRNIIEGDLIKGDINFVEVKA